MKKLLFLALLFVLYHGHAQIRSDICDKIIIGDFKCSTCSSPLLSGLPKNVRNAVGQELKYPYCEVLNRDRLADILNRKDKEKLIAELADLSTEEKQTLTSIVNAKRVLFGEMEVQPADNSLLVTLVINNLETGVQESTTMFEIPSGEYDTHTKREPYIAKGIEEALLGKKRVSDPATDEKDAAVQEPAPKPMLTEQDVLAAKGGILAKQDPLAQELRNREPEGPSRRGFDIGMAAAEGQTAPGPGKDKMCASLKPAEQIGFKTAVWFSLERNRNFEFAAVGAAIAKANPVIARARTVNPSVFFWLGFDIATGIFGDPALGARGNTATGPGSLKIRDSLSVEGQKGFNASVKLHLGPPPLPRRG